MVCAHFLILSETLTTLRGCEADLADERSIAHFCSRILYRRGFGHGYERLTVEATCQSGVRIILRTP